MAFYMVLLLAVTSCCMKMKGASSEVVNVTSTKYQSDPLNNLTDPAKDMYVIRATVYQVGILTNSTDNTTDSFNSTGNQESVTLYHTNGSSVDLSAIPEPLLTNLTAQTYVGVAPIPAKNVDEPQQMKRSVDYDIMLRLFKRDTKSAHVRFENGTALIPPEAGIQSLSLPPLLSLNNNLTIPVPIPNTSVVHYAKVNTLLQKP